MLKDGRDILFLDSVTDRGRDNRSLLFAEPEQALEIRTAQDIKPFFQGIEAALAKGFYVAGWFAYELGYLLLPGLSALLDKKSPGLPLAWMGVFRKPLEVQHGSLEAWSPCNLHSVINGMYLDVSRREFVERIGEIHEFIRMGDTYQVNYTIRGWFEYPGPALDLYLCLRQRQEVNYAAFIRAAGTEIACLSPELFFRRFNNHICSRPMKGTAARGADSAEDVEIARFLQADSKNRAENVMIVDLIRNDLGRICRHGSVSVPALFKVEEYQTLFQMISEVEGILQPQVSWQDCISALFPCGSITGAPKIRTMEIIEALEKHPRGIYTGSIGYIAPDSSACFNVAIRTITMEEDKGEIGIGAGITIYSDPEAEFEETLLKARFLTGNIRHR